MKPNVPTMGELTVDLGARELFRCHTLEPPWLWNKRRVSCIPPDTYTALFLPTAKFPRLHESEPWYKDHLWELVDVPDRDECKFHHGTSVDDTEGCPLLGLEATKTGISKSRAALKGFHLSLSAYESGPVTVRVLHVWSK